MFLAHSIRLRDPWQCEATPDGGLRWSRVFHRPTGLEPDDELLLVICDLTPGASVAVNGRRLALKGESPARFEITSLLNETNRVELELPDAPCRTQPATSSDFPFDVRLAIVGHS